MYTAYLSPSVFPQAKQTRQIEIHQSQPISMTFELVAHLPRIDMKQTQVCSVCDWLISKSTLKDGFVTDRLNTLAPVIWNCSVFKRGAHEQLMRKLLVTSVIYHLPNKNNNNNILEILVQPTIKWQPSISI